MSDDEQRRLEDEIFRSFGGLSAPSSFGGKEVEPGHRQDAVSTKAGVSRDGVSRDFVRAPGMPAVGARGERRSVEEVVRIFGEAFGVEAGQVVRAPRGKRDEGRKASLLAPAMPVWRTVGVSGKVGYWIGEGPWYRVWLGVGGVLVRIELLCWEYDVESGTYVRGMEGLNDRGYVDGDLVASVWTARDYRALTEDVPASTGEDEVVWTV